MYNPVYFLRVFWLEDKYIYLKYNWYEWSVD